MKKASAIFNATYITPFVGVFCQHPAQNRYLKGFWQLQAYWW